jgi:hypothetical protein
MGITSVVPPSKLRHCERSEAIPDFNLKQFLSTKVCRDKSNKFRAGFFIFKFAGKSGSGGY